MKKLKNILGVLFIACALLFVPNDVFAENAYITYSEIKVKDENINGISHSYNGQDGEYIEYYMNEKDNNIYSFKITGYNLIDDALYTYTLKSDFKNFVKTYTGEELKNGIVISGEDGNSIFQSDLIDKDNNIIRNKHDDVYYKKTRFKFNYNFDSSEMDEYINKIAPNGKMKISAIDSEGDGAFAETSITASLQKYETEDFWLYGGCYDEDGSCSISISNKKDFNKDKKYLIEFEYEKTDKKIKEKLDKYAKTFNYNNETIEKELFVMEDLETINYKYAVSIYGDTIDTLNSIINYSSEFQKKLNNTNITAILDSRAGWEERFTSGGFGFLNLLYNGVIYSYAPVAGVKQNNVLYVPNDTDDTRNAYINTALKRIKDYIPDANVKIEYAGQISDLNFEEEMLQLEDIVDATKTLGEYYSLTINNEQYYYFIAKDSSKMKKPLMNTKDVNTDISIRTDSAEVPLDTKISAIIIDSNSNEYKEFLKKVNINKGIVVDLKLFSESINKNISKISNNKFKVYIPLPEELKKIDLMAYYVKDNGEIENYDVTFEDGYLVFATDHFSTYIIGGNEKTQINPETEEVPKTFDNISASILIGVISLIGFVGTTLYLKKRNIVRA